MVSLVRIIFRTFASFPSQRIGRNCETEMTITEHRRKFTCLFPQQRGYRLYPSLLFYKSYRMFLLITATLLVSIYLFFQFINLQVSQSTDGTRPVPGCISLHMQVWGSRIGLYRHSRRYPSTTSTDAIP